MSPRILNSEKHYVGLQVRVGGPELELQFQKAAVICVCHFETWTHYVALALLELSMWPLNTRKPSLRLCMSAGANGVHHHTQA